MRVHARYLLYYPLLSLYFLFGSFSLHSLGVYRHLLGVNGYLLEENRKTAHEGRLYNQSKNGTSEALAFSPSLLFKSSKTNSLIYPLTVKPCAWMRFLVPFGSLQDTVSHNSLARSFWRLALSFSFFVGILSPPFQLSISIINCKLSIGNCQLQLSIVILNKLNHAIIYYNYLFLTNLIFMCNYLLQLSIASRIFILTIKHQTEVIP